jgi:hypothetical protein
MTILRMRFECWIPKATNTRSEYVILIAFPLQHWLRERAPVLRYMFIACLVLFLGMFRHYLSTCTCNIISHILINYYQTNAFNSW